MEQNYLVHHGVKGMKWGVRRYQNPDGTLTDLGKRRNAKSLVKNYEKHKNPSYPTLTGPTYDMKARKLVQDHVSKEDISRLSESYKKWIDIEKKNESNDFWKSKEYEEARKYAYDDTYKWFAKNDPNYLKRIIKENDGDKAGLDAFHDFRKTLEGHEDYYLNEYEKKYYSDPVRKKLQEESNKAYEDFKNSSRNVVNSILGSYGDTVLYNDEHRSRPFTINDTLAGELSDMAISRVTKRK